MRRGAPKLRILYPEEQRFACQECPARCCKNWGIPVAPEVAHVILSDEELRTRLVGRAPGILASGTLPMIERDGQLQCVLLDEDSLCALQKRHGHDALPGACQAFPFGFVKNQQSEIVAQLSPYCPSIRDNRGSPLSGLVHAKFQQAGRALTLAPRMGLRSGRTLPTKLFGLIVEAWRELVRTRSPLEAVLAATHLTDQVDEHLAGKEFRPEDVKRALEVASTSPNALEPVRAKRPGWHARLFYAHVLGGLSYPSRVLVPYAAERPSFAKRARAWGNKLAWLLHLGAVDLLHVPAPIAPRRVDRIPPFLAGPLGRPVSTYLDDLLAGGQLFTRQTYLNRVLVDLGLGVSTISRFARARALGHGRSEVLEADVLEGIGLADLLFTHRAETKNPVIDNLRLTLMSDPEAFRRFLASEV